MYTGEPVPFFLSFFLSFFLPFFLSFFLSSLCASISLSLVRVSNSLPHRERLVRALPCSFSLSLVSPLLLSSLASLTTRAAPRDLCKHRPIHWATCSYIGGGDVEQKRAERSVTDASL